MLPQNVESTTFFDDSPYYAHIMQIESRNNGLEMQSVNNKGLVEELEKLLERLRIPQEVWFRQRGYSSPIVN